MVALFPGDWGYLRASTFGFRSVGSALGDLLTADELEGLYISTSISIPLMSLIPTYILYTYIYIDIYIIP